MSGSGLIKRYMYEDGIAIKIEVILRWHIGGILKISH